MPLHLLGKKSWNVYNTENIAKVKRDEEAAAAREAEEEQRMQEADAERRIQILRGLPVVDIPPRSPRSTRKENERNGEQQESHDNGVRRDKKRRRIAGENDTERDIRFAMEDSAAAPARRDLSLKSSKGTEVSLTDKNGHINLFPTQTSSRGHSFKNAEAEADAARKKREFEDQYTMRFSNAAGFKTAIGEKPWYHSLEALVPPAENEAGGAEPVAKNVWGNEDPRRKEREKARLMADDPLALIHKGVSGLREVEREREKWKAEKQRETEELLREEKRRSRNRRSHHRHHRHDHHHNSNDDDLENFSLDASPRAGAEPGGSTHESHHRRTHRHHRHERESRRPPHQYHHHDDIPAANFHQYRNHSSNTEQESHHHPNHHHNHKRPPSSSHSHSYKSSGLSQDPNHSSDGIT